MSWRWWRESVVFVTIGLVNGAKIITPVDAIDWAAWFDVERRAA